MTVAFFFLSSPGVVSALLSSDNWAIKIALLRFLEQVWGVIAIAVTPATNVIDLTPVPRMTAAPATPHSPIVIHILEVQPAGLVF